MLELNVHPSAISFVFLKFSFLVSIYLWNLYSAPSRYSEALPAQAWQRGRSLWLFYSKS